MYETTKTRTNWGCLVAIFAVVLCWAVVIAALVLIF